jgi:hypothetical protein
MRQTISGLVAAIAVMTAGAAPAMACGGGGLSGSSCSPCGQGHVSRCAQSYVPVTVDSECYSGCGWTHEVLSDPERQYGAASRYSAGPQYYYVNQGPTYTGPGNFAPYPTYRESAVPVVYSYRAHRHHRPWRHHGYAPHRYGHHQHALRRYY